MHIQASDEADSRATLTTRPHIPSLKRKPHDRPNFHADSFVHPKSAILYLPPLLSSLPHDVSPEPILHLEHLPLATQTRLPDIDPVSLSLHKALHYFKPAVANYATAPYKEAFNWAQLILPVEEEREWYCVVFRSKRRAGSDNEALYAADRDAHEEAVGAGGLILYWYGTPEESSGLNLATCIWQSRKHAVAANSGPHHIKAMRLAKVSYEIYDLERHVLRKEKGQLGVTVHLYTDGEVGW